MAPNPPQQVLQTVWTLPNVVSLLRLIILLPLTSGFLFLHQFGAAFVSLLMLAVTDWLDGFLARRLDQVSEFGKNLDPIADRLSVIVVGFSMTLVGILPWQFIAIIYGVDLVLTGASILWFRGSPGVPVSRLGKLRTAVVLVALPLVILGQATSLVWIDRVGLILLTVGVVGHVLAGGGYLLAMRRVRQPREAR